MVRKEDKRHGGGLTGDRFRPQQKTRAKEKSKIQRVEEELAVVPEAQHT